MTTSQAPPQQQSAHAWGDIAAQRAQLHARRQVEDSYGYPREAPTPLFLGAFLSPADRAAVLGTFKPTLDESLATHVTLTFKPDAQALRVFPFGERALGRCKWRSTNDNLDAVAVSLSIDGTTTLEQEASDTLAHPVTHILLASSNGVAPVTAHHLLDRERESPPTQPETTACAFYVTFGCLVSWRDGSTTVIYDRDFFSTLAERQLQKELLAMSEGHREALSRVAQLEGAARQDETKLAECKRQLGEVRCQIAQRDRAHREELSKSGKKFEQKLAAVKRKLEQSEAEHRKKLARSEQQLAEANAHAEQQIGALEKKSADVTRQLRECQAQLEEQRARRSAPAAAPAAPPRKKSGGGATKKKKKKNGRGEDKSEDDALLQRCIEENRRAQTASAGTQTQRPAFEQRAEESWYDAWLREREVNERLKQQHNVFLTVMHKLREQIKQLQKTEIEVRGEVATAHLQLTESRAVVTILKNETSMMKSLFVNSKDATFRGICARSDVPPHVADLVARYADFADTVDLQGAMADCATHSVKVMRALTTKAGGGRKKGTPLANEIASFECRVNLELANYLHDCQLQQHELKKLQAQGADNVRLRAELEKVNKDLLDGHRLALELANRGAADAYADVFAQLARLVVHVRQIGEALREWLEGGGEKGGYCRVPRTALEAMTEALLATVAAVAADGDDALIVGGAVNPFAPHLEYGGGVAPSWTNLLLAADALERADQETEEGYAKLVAEGRARREVAQASMKRLSVRAYGPTMVSSSAFARLDAVREEAIASLGTRGSAQDVYAAFFSKCQKGNLLDAETLALLNNPPPARNINERFFRSIRPGMCAPADLIKSPSSETPTGANPTTPTARQASCGSP